MTGFFSRLDAAFAASGAAAWGGVSFSALLPHMDSGAAEKARALCPGARTVLTAAYPYYAGDRPGNLSLYARGEDYHQVLVRRLTPVCNLLKEIYPECSFLPATDTSPLPEREAAWLSGLGLRGKNGLVILPPYGTYVFLGTILTDAPLPLPQVRSAPDCAGCGACAKACPTGALGAGGFQGSRCLSHLTQKKGALSGEEAALVAAHPYAWGCDLCQRACPYNRAPEFTALPEFSTGLVDTLTPGMVEGQTNRTFRARYGGRAFSWRGPAVIRRNLALQEDGDGTWFSTAASHPVENAGEAPRRPPRREERRPPL